mgnify:CR=1 FL=1
MVTTEYKIAYSEILEILKHISKKEQDKIPSNMIEMFKANASENSNFVYNPRKTLKEQNVSEIGISIIAILYRDYWATKEQKQKILNFQNREREKYKAEKYDVNNIFKKKNEVKSAFAEEYSVIVQKKNFIQKIIGKIKEFIFNYK